MATYSAEQTTFCLCMLSNLGSGVQGDADSIAAQVKGDLTKIFADAKIQNMIGKWDLVWGPKVVVGPMDLELHHKAINTMYIAHNAETNNYTVAIAGTNASSLYDWFVEDFWVNKQVVWPFLPADFKGTKPKISNGTNFGLNQLIGMADNQASAREYLRDHISDGSTVMVTGHSLGGALSPSYGLYLKDTAKEWDPNNKAKLDVMAMAGATPGDSNFVTYFNDRVGSTYERVWNSIDVVPHAWQPDQLQAIPSLYAPTIEPDLVLKALATVALFISRKGDYKQLNTVAGFPSEVQSETGDTIKMFLAELLYQHIQAYYNHFQVLEFQKLEKILLAKPVADQLMDKDIDAIAKKIVEKLIIQTVEHKIPGVDLAGLKSVFTKL